MGIQLRKMCRSKAVVVFGATSRIGRSVVEVLAGSKRMAVIAAVENVRGMRARRLKRVTNCFLVQFDPASLHSLCRAVRHADAVVLVPTISPGGSRFAKRLIDAVGAEQVPAGIVLVSSLLAAADLSRPSVAQRPEVAEAEGFEAIEAHARNVLGETRGGSRSIRCVSIRIPLLMESILYCRDEIMFANRFVGCVEPTTMVPCIAVRDVAVATACALVQLLEQHSKAAEASGLPPLQPIYSLTNAAVASLSASELSRELSALLNRPIKYCQLSNTAFLERMKEKGAPDTIAQSMVAMKDMLEANTSEGKDDAETSQEAEEPERSTGGVPVSGSTTAGSNIFRSTQDFHRLTQSEMLTPMKWLVTNRAIFERTAQNQMQLFVVGGGDGIFVEIGQFLAIQVTEPTTRPPPDVGEGALPTTDIVGEEGEKQAPQQAKVTLCTIKSPPEPTGDRSSAGAHHEANPPAYYQVEGSRSSPVAHLLDQLTSLDVVLFIPPLRLGATTCLEITKTVVAAAARADVWGIVVVSSVFAGTHRGAGHRQLHEMDAIEEAIKNSGVAYVIVRLPLFPEYLLSLSGGREASRLEPMPEERPSEEQLSSSSDQGSSQEYHSMEHPSPEMASAYAKSRGGVWPPTASPSALEEKKPPGQSASDEGVVPLLSRNLASSRLYWMSLSDAAKALVAISFTFPLHRNRTRTLFTETKTLEEVIDLAQAAVAQRKRSRSAAAEIDMRHVDALNEAPGREFWKVGYWPRRHLKQFLECAVELSGADDELKASAPFELVTDCAPVTMERWMQLHAKALGRAFSR